jgi:hypothetical protein
MRLISIFLLLLAVMFASSLTAKGKEVPWPKWTDEVRLDFGKCLYSEDSSGTDWSALGWSLVKQWRLRRDGRFVDYTFHKQVRWYCAVFERNGPRWLGQRPGRILRATWEKAPYEREIGEWEQLRDFVGEFERQEITDPCPKCMWWGGPSCGDVIPEHWFCPLGPHKDGSQYRKNAFCYLVKKPRKKPRSR